MTAYTLRHTIGTELAARGVPELNEELERAMRDRRYGFRRKDRYSAFGMSITAAKWAMVPVVLGLALIAIGVALLLA